MDGQSENAGKEENPLSLHAVCPLSRRERESVRRRPDARWACSGMVYGLRAEQKRAQKKKSRIGFNVSFRAAKVPSWMSWQSLKKLELLIPSGTLPEVVWRECPSKSCSKSHGFPLSRRETPAGYMILYISSQPLRSGTSLSRRISSALTRQKPLSSLSYVLVLLYKIICLCESM